MIIETNILKSVKNYAYSQKVTTAYIYKLIKSGRIEPVVIDGIIFVNVEKFPSIKN